jgi:hypothetical protein
MSRLYSMQIMVHNFNTEKEEKIEEAVREIWNVDDSWKDPDDSGITFYGESNLCGGESEEEFSERMAKKVWKANEGYCEVNINATYLEELPYESYGFDEEEYEKLMKKEE